MLKRIVAIAFIFLCASAAWMVLGATVFSRTYDSDQVLEGQVTSLWGAPQSQSPPAATTEHLVPDDRDVGERQEEGRHGKSLRDGDSTA